MLCSFNANFSIEHIETLSSIWHYNDLCTLDLSKVCRVYPAGVVGFVLVTYKRFLKGSSTHVLVPESIDVLNYLERIDFFRKLKGLVSFDKNITYLAGNRRNESDKFSEIATPEDSNFEQIKNVFLKFFMEKIPSNYKNVYSTFEEVLKNIKDHSSLNSSSFAYSCVQSQIYVNRIELAFGDLGQGFLNTLRTNTSYNLTTEAEALEGALIRGYSRLKDSNPERGGGLRRVSQIVKNCNGEMQIMSRNGIYRPNCVSADFTNGPNEFPGTFVHITIPRFC